MLQAPLGGRKHLDDVSHFSLKKTKQRKISMPGRFINHTIKTLNPNIIIRLNHSGRNSLHPIPDITSSALKDKFNPTNRQRAMFLKQQNPPGRYKIIWCNWSSSEEELKKKEKTLIAKSKWTFLSKRMESVEDTETGRGVRHVSALLPSRSC